MNEKRSKTNRSARSDRHWVEVRAQALDVLVRSESERLFVDEVLARTPADADRRNRPLLQEMVYGVMRHSNTLDMLVDFYLKHPLAKQRPEVRAAMRIGAYQLVYLTKIPAHAAVYQTLEALKSRPGLERSVVGFVNAILQKLSADVRKKGPEPPDSDDDPTVLPIRYGFCHFHRPVLPLRRMDPVGHFALKQSHPHWLVARWLERFGEEETCELCAVNNSIPRLIARVTSLAPSRDAVLDALREEGVEVEPGALEDSVYLTRRGDPQNSPTLARGWIQIQDETAIAIGSALAPPAAARVVDLCAAPGGKALQLFERVKDGGHLLALDRSAERLVFVQETLARVGTAFTTQVAPEDPRQLDLGEQYSHILVDAPCSNTGVLARRPEARWRIRRNDLDSLSELQLQLLEAAYRHLRPGGRVLYSTCSIESEENEAIVARLCNAHPDLTEVKTKLFLPTKLTP